MIKNNKKKQKKDEYINKFLRLEIWKFILELK